MLATLPINASLVEWEFIVDMQTIPDKAYLRYSRFSYRYTYVYKDYSNEMIMHILVHARLCIIDRHNNIFIYFTCMYGRNKAHLHAIDLILYGIQVTTETMVL